jgi:hypothetical protein
MKNIICNHCSVFWSDIEDAGIKFLQNVSNFNHFEMALVYPEDFTMNMYHCVNLKSHYL